MKLNYNKHKNSIFLIFFYFLVFFITFLNINDYGIHIEEKFHRLNGLFWVNYIFDLLGLNNLAEISQTKIDQIYDYTLNRPSYYNKYGVVLDLPVAFLEIFLSIDDVNKIYTLKHLLSFLIFLISSIFFYKLLLSRYNFFLSFVGVAIFIFSPRIFGDSFLYKDVLFLSFITITIYYFNKSINIFNYRNIILLSLFSSLSVNLRFFAIIIPFLFIFTSFIKKNNLNNITDFCKKISFYILFFIFFLIIFWPYLWSDPLNNFLNLFKNLSRDLVDVKILYNNEFISNRLLPNTYILNWIAITTPVLQFISFFLGFIFCFLRLIKRFINIKEKSIYNDFWRGKNEETDFIIFIIFISFYFLFIFFEAPLYNGWRLVYFFNIFITYFVIYFISIIFGKVKNIFTKRTLIFFSLIIVMININAVIKFHPFQSIYFNKFLSEKTVNGYEGDYYGIASKHFFKKILSKNDSDKIYVAVASHTPLQRGIEGLPAKDRKKFIIVGQEYQMADYIFKNNISEVNSRLNKKYEIPENFSKVYTFKVNKIIVYEIFKKELTK